MLSKDAFWWEKLGFPSFSEGTGENQGFPDPGEVVSYYRSKKEIITEDGRRRTCRQIDLANMLGVSESWVRAMELQNKGLDSISRRKALVLALNIPPILLGLVPITDLLSQTQSSLHTTPTSLSWLHDSLSDAWQLYYTGTHTQVKENVGRKIHYLSIFAEAEDTHLKNQLLALQCRFYFLSARIACDQTEYQEAYSYLRKATKIAEQLDDKELLALCYFWRGRAYLEEERYPAAVIALNKALSHTKDNAGKVVVPPSLYGCTLLELGLARAYTIDPQNKKAKQEVLDLFQKAKTVASQAPTSDSTFVMINLGRYYHFKAEALIAMKMPEEALEALDKADMHTAPQFTRRKAYIGILRAQAALDMEDYTYAAHQALEAVNTCKAIRSEVNLEELKHIGKALNTSPFANSETVGKLNIALMNI
ncbi:tetratricopeptide repeat protein [Thermosporothrix hazakensis]|uniref:Tetratricopeptide repeat protein n=1 Tax=Thermosporothrix hazakensis TaxID=644383 RepID=A0A326TRJ8_THEHA|nr:tetratricopeptide repeat protein [Thermosporothrix hazakensis]PZW18077.1 tetratricopeptide repeat protein [Thermosporothrix hazakensis]GCE50686.1 hypothetical protein KTH_55550 [Thermosporothrix hazakensis]